MSLNEKSLSSPPPLHLKDPAVAQKTSQETMSSTSTHVNEKRGATSTEMEVPRSSGLSTTHSNQLSPFDTDVEAMITPSTSQQDCNRTLIKKKGGVDCQVWPGRDHWKQKAKAAKQKRTCNCLSRLSKRNRMLVRILLVVLVVCIAVAVGFGISKPLGAGIWKPS